MSRVERKEYQETKIMRTVSPIRGTNKNYYPHHHGGSAQNLHQFDQNLDHLLEDLQSSVSPSQYNREVTTTTRSTAAPPSLRNGFGSDDRRSQSLSRVTNLTPQNPITDYSSDDTYSYTSPDGKRSVRSYKKESYASYKSGGGGSATNLGPDKLRMQNNISQLDSLLDDLQQVKHHQRATDSSVVEQRSYSANNRTGGTVPTAVTTTTTVHESRPRGRTLDRRIENRVDYASGDEGNYGDLLARPPSASSSSYGTLTKQKAVTNVRAYPLEVIETTTPEINPEILVNLDPQLLPTGNTKVTTTIKTYTYEIPGQQQQPSTTTTSLDDTIVDYSGSQVGGTTPSKSFVYASNRSNASTRHELVNVAPYQKPAPPIIATPVDRAESPPVVRETITTRNYQPGNVSPIADRRHRQHGYYYNETTTTRNYDDRSSTPYYAGPETPNYQPYPQQQQQPPLSPSKPVNAAYVYKETTTTTVNNDNRQPPQQQQQPLPRRPNETIVYRDVRTSTNQTDGNRPPGSHRDVVEVFDGAGPPPKEPINVTYKYSSHTSTTNNVRGGGDYPPYGGEREPLLRPKPFPTTGSVDDDADGPPKKLDELMATIGHEPPNSPLNAGYNRHEYELAQQRKIDTLKQQHEEKFADNNNKSREPKDLQRTRNVTGPPVYYPPGHEMFARKEEAEGGAWRAEGAMARESGKYKYAAESNSKTKTKSGAAIVPVCLPLCCGLPCTIL